MDIDHLNKVRAELNQVSPSFCLAKWKQVTLHLFNGNTQSCHHVESHRVSAEEIAADPGALHNSACKKAVRAQMLGGKFPKECRYCWNVEKVGQYSDRVHKSSETWALPYLTETAKQPATSRTFPTYLEVAFSNACNFKCMYCSPIYSSLWEQEIREHGAYPTSRLYNNFWGIKILKHEPLQPEDQTKYVQAFWDWWPEVSPHLHHLRVTGGEPFLSEETWQLMDSLIESPQPNLAFSINSNMSLSEAVLKRFVDKLQQLEGKVRKVTLFCSIDSVNKQAEYIRFGLKYPRFIDNVERLLRDSRVPIHISFMITVNALSLPGLKPLVGWIARLRREFPHHEIGIDTPYLRLPQHLSVFILPAEWTRYLEDALEEMRKNEFHPFEQQKLERIADLMRAGMFSAAKKTLLRGDFMSMLYEGDRRRKTDFRATFPEYADFFAECERSFLIKKVILPFTYFSASLRQRFQNSRISGKVSKKQVPRRRSCSEKNL